MGIFACWAADAQRKLADSLFISTDPKLLYCSSKVSAIWMLHR